MKRRICGILVLSGLLFMSGCASVFTGTNEKIVVSTPDAQSSIYVDGMLRGKGNIIIDKTKGKTHLLTVKQEGCQDITTVTSNRFNGVSVLNIFFWPGFFIDLATGALWEADPSSYTLNPICPTQPTQPKTTPTTTQM